MVMEVPRNGSQRNGGRHVLLVEDWKKGIERALLRIGEMTGDPNFAGWWKNFEPKFKQIVSEAFWKLWQLNRNGRGYKHLSEEQIRKDLESLEKEVKRMIYPPVADPRDQTQPAKNHLSTELYPFENLLSSTLRYFKRFASRSLWFHCVNPYLSGTSTCKKFIMCVYDYFFNEHRDKLGKLEQLFRLYLGDDWRDSVYGTSRKVLDYVPPPPKEDGYKPYGRAVDSVKFFRNAFTHYKQHLPRNKKTLSDEKIEELIFQEFPGGYEKIYKAVETLLLDEGPLNRAEQERLFNKLFQSVIDSKDDGPGGDSCVQTGSTADGPSHQIMNVRTRESAEGGVSQQKGRTVCNASR